MKIGSKLCPMFVLNHKKYKPVFVAGTHVYFFVVRNQRRAEFWTEYHAFFCNRFRILTASVLSAHFFRFLPRDLKKLIQNGLFLIHNECGELVSIFWSPWVKKKSWADNPEALRILKLLQWTACCCQNFQNPKGYRVIGSLFFCSGTSKNSH